MTQEEYLKNKEERKQIWLQKVFAHSMCETEQEEHELLKEALEKFEREYPKWKQSA